MSFKNYLLNESSVKYTILTEEKLKELNEVLITFGNRPKFGQVVLLAGGAGSGKGFITNKILGIDAKTFDVDQVKTQIIDPSTPKINKTIQDKYGVDVTKLDLKKPDDVALLHKINDELGLSTKKQDLFFKNLSNKDRLPNVMFDTTMKSEKKIADLVKVVQDAGYKKENIHIIWIMTPINVALKQNKERDRVVPEDILLDTHKGVAENMNNLMKKQKFQDYIDGYVYIVFNQAYVDNTLKFSSKGGNYVKDAVILQIKEKGKKALPYAEITKKYLRKIKKYVPKEMRSLWGKF